MKTAVINFASQRAWFPAGAERLRASLLAHGYSGDFRFESVEKDIPSPSHEDAPYAFKPAMFVKAMRAGYDIVLWCDAAMFAVRPITPLLDHIAACGQLLFNNGCVGEWSSDVALESFGVTREEAFKITEISGCCMGFDLRSPVTKAFINEWSEKSLDGKTFKGSWTNQDGSVSSDPRVKGHRHDQTAASIIAHKLGISGVSRMMQYYYSKDGRPYRLEYDNDMSVLRDDTCICNQGM